MANLYALVLDPVTGLKRQASQASDIILGTFINSEVESLINNEAAPIVVGTLVYSQAAGAVKKAKADALATAQVVGLVSSIGSIANGVSGPVQIGKGSVLTLTTGQWDAIAGTSGGLAFGVNYFLSAATAGLMTATAPTTVGQVNVLIGVALSSTQLELILDSPILL